MKRKKPPTIGTNRTPPPTPPSTARMPSMNVTMNRARGHIHHGADELEGGIEAIVSSWPMDDAVAAPGRMITRLITRIVMNTTARLDDISPSPVDKNFVLHNAIYRLHCANRHNDIIMMVILSSEITV